MHLSKEKLSGFQILPDLGILNMGSILYFEFVNVTFLCCLMSNAEESGKRS
jgi:hypothetical protein